MSNSLSNEVHFSGDRKSMFKRLVAAGAAAITVATTTALPAVASAASASAPGAGGKLNGGNPRLYFPKKQGYLFSDRSVR
jgi:hypothetical protein